MGNVHCTVADLVALTSRTITPEGYLLAPGTIGTSGNVQRYTADELGLDGKGLGKDRMLGLYRPPEEVLTADCLASFDAKPITLNHPKEGVSSANWRDVAVGDVRDVKAAGPHMSASLIIRDRKAVAAIIDGKQALSNGYSFDLDLTPGKTADGLAYDGIQRNIRGNHVAIVDLARGGSACRIADKQEGATHMALRKLVVDGLTMELEDNHAAVVEKVVGDAAKTVKGAEDALAAARKSLADAETKVAALEEAAKKLATDHAAKVVELEAKILKPEQVEALAAERTKVLGDAALLCPEAKFEGKTVTQVRTECLTAVIAADAAMKPVALAVLGGVELVLASEPTVRAAFDAVVAAHGLSAPAQGSPAVVNPDIARAFAGAPPKAAAPKLTGRDAMMARMKGGGKLPGEASN